LKNTRYALCARSLYKKSSSAPMSQHIGAGLLALTPHRNNRSLDSDGGGRINQIDRKLPECTSSLFKQTR
jgi:hypothetical protein